MSTILENNIRNLLKTVTYPKTGKDIVSEGIISPLIIKDGKVIFSLNMIHDNYGLYESMKERCEPILQEVDGVKAVSFAITQHEKPKPHPKPEANKQSIPGVKNVIIVASGKGGVGKSTVAVNLTVALSQLGYKAGIVDADIYGPSIPTMMGVKQKPELNEKNKMVPIERHGIKSNSIGYMVDQDGALVWRGAMITKAIQQLLMGTDWAGEDGDLDYLIIDTPPGTGDIHITVAKYFTIKGAVIVTTPQEVALMDVSKIIDMYQKVDIPIIGLVENMSYLKIQPSDEPIYPFGSGGGEKTAAEYDISLLGSLPMDPKISHSGDNGTPIALEAEEISKKITSIAGIISKG